MIDHVAVKAMGFSEFPRRPRQKKKNHLFYVNLSDGRGLEAWWHDIIRVHLAWLSNPAGGQDVRDNKSVLLMVLFILVVL